MGRRTNQSRIITLLHENRDGLSGSVIQSKLNLSEKTYDRERERLLLEGLAQKKRGRGGGLRLTDSFLEALDKATGVASQETSTGSAFFVSSEGHLLTNYHVVEGASRIVVAFKGRDYIAAVQEDPDNDLALLKIEYRPAVWATFRDTVRLGEDVGAFGFPLTSVLTKTGNFSRGSVTGVAGLDDEPSRFQIQVPIQAGNSGGPVADASGCVVGVVVSAVRKSNYSVDDMPENANFAIRADTAIGFMQQCKLKIAVSRKDPDGGNWPGVASRLVDMTALVYADEGHGEPPPSGERHAPSASVARLALSSDQKKSAWKGVALWVVGLGTIMSAVAVSWGRVGWPF